MSTRKANAEKRAKNRARNAICSVEACGCPAKAGRGGMCEKHYMRVYRTGTTDLLRTATPFTHSNGYVLVPAKGHPMALSGSHAYEHRVVYYDAYGNGPFDCHWCGALVTWSSMHVDHVDADRQNNSIDNLVASCPRCNQNRDKSKSIETWRRRGGIPAFGVVRTLSEWSREYGISRASISSRIKAGWSVEDAISKPRGKYGPKGNWDMTDWRPTTGMDDSNQRGAA